jgi:multicomponent Na+:H+ antiporter subunit D
MIMGLGLLSVIGVAAGIAYIVNQIVVKTGLFLVAGEIEAEVGGSDLDDGSGLATKRPWLAVSFAALALSLAGVPPLGGFVLKFALVQEGLTLGQWGVVAVALVVSLLTLFSMMKIWSGVFWGDVAASGPGARRGMKLVTGGVAVISLGIAFVASDLMAASTRAAEALVALAGGGL